MSSYCIDVHNHIIPEEYVSGLKKVGLTESLGRSFPVWSAEKSIEIMDLNEIQTAITSISSPGVFFGDEYFAKNLARMCNEISATLISDYPSRFGGFASLPLPYLEASLDEIDYSLDILKLDGFVFLSNYKGTYIGDQSFESIYYELNKKNAVVYVHPTDPESGNPLKGEIPTFLMEVTFETARVIFNLLYKGIFERYPNIRWIFSHAGGALPYLTWRISLGQLVLPDAKNNVPKGVLHYLKQLYYDTALSANPYVFNTLKELVGSEKILFGSDYPFAPDILTTETIKGVKAYEFFSEKDKEMIQKENALKLFPRLEKYFT